MPRNGWTKRIVTAGALAVAGVLATASAQAQTTIRVIATGEPYSNAMKAAAAAGEPLIVINFRPALLEIELPGDV